MQLPNPNTKLPPRSCAPPSGTGPKHFPHPSLFFPPPSATRKSKSRSPMAPPLRSTIRFTTTTSILSSPNKSTAQDAPPPTAKVVPQLSATPSTTLSAPASKSTITPSSTKDSAISSTLSANTSSKSSRSTRLSTASPAILSHVVLARVVPDISRTCMETSTRGIIPVT